VGKRLLVEWLAMPEAERLAAVAKWIAERRAGKDIN
jgi:hypothetical protein